jgi:hypothetical protein
MIEGDMEDLRGDQSNPRAPLLALHQIFAHASLHMAGGVMQARTMAERPSSSPTLNTSWPRPRKPKGESTIELTIERNIEAPLRRTRREEPSGRTSVSSWKD